MSQLLQLDGELPDHFPGHERRIHIFACRTSTCSRKEGTIRAIRSTKVYLAGEESNANRSSASSLATDLGSTLFQVKSPQAGSSSSVNPISAGSFAARSDPSADPVRSSPFRPPKESYKPNEQGGNTRDEHVGHIQQPCSTPTPSLNQDDASAKASSMLPGKNFPFYYLDAEREVVEPPANLAVPSREGRYPMDKGQETDSTIDDSHNGYESTADKTFQRFADRLAQNPMQVLRYEYKGTPLLYSSNDSVGKLLSRQYTKSYGFRSSNMGIPRCPLCGNERVFELQLTPYVIAELERGEEGSDGMEWGTIILAVCTADCQSTAEHGRVDYAEEWIGVQWEESKTVGTL